MLKKANPDYRTALFRICSLGRRTFILRIEAMNAKVPVTRGRPFHLPEADLSASENRTVAAAVIFEFNDDLTVDL